MREVQNRAGITITRWTLVLVLLGAMALRLPGLSRALWFDETFTVTMTESLRDLFSILARDVHPPLFFLLFALVRRISDSETVWRLLPFLAAAVTVGATYRLGKILWSRAVGTCAAALLAFSVFHMEVSTEMRPYALLALFTTLALGSFWAAVRHGERRDWLAFSFWMAAGLYTHYAALFLAISLALSVLAFRAMDMERWWSPEETNGVSWRNALAACVLILVLCSPWMRVLWDIAKHYRVTGYVFQGDTFNPGKPLGGRFLLDVLWDFSGRSWHALVLYGFAFSYGWILLVRSRSRRAVLLALVFIVPPVSLFVARPKHFLDTRYFLLLLPPYLVGVAAGLEAAARRVWGFFSETPLAGKTYAAIAAGFLLVCLAPGTALLRWIRADDWRDVTAYLGASMAKGECLYFEPGIKSPPLVRRYANEDLNAKMIQRGTLPWRNPGVAESGKSDRMWVVHRVPKGSRRPDWPLEDVPAISRREFHMVNAEVTVFCFKRETLIPALQEAARPGDGARRGDDCSRAGGS